ncbi:MAG: hypothetical protein KIS66_06235 [Fimbriimonadaceae bacterium]|nr:hypothetical protein [Fimbriimonadaceae bacterium]
MIETNLEVSDAGRSVAIRVRVWRDSEGHGIVALDPRDNESWMFMLNERRFIQDAIKNHYSIEHARFFESHLDGAYTLSKDSLIVHGPKHTDSSVVQLGNHLEHLGWKQAQDMSRHQLPPLQEP